MSSSSSESSSSTPTDLAKFIIRIGETECYQVSTVADLIEVCNAVPIEDIKKTLYSSTEGGQADSQKLYPLGDLIKRMLEPKGQMSSIEAISPPSSIQNEVVPTSQSEVVETSIPVPLQNPITTASQPEVVKESTPTIAPAPEQTPLFSFSGDSSAFKKCSNGFTLYQPMSFMQNPGHSIVSAMLPVSTAAAQPMAGQSMAGNFGMHENVSVREYYNDPTRRQDLTEAMALQQLQSEMAYQPVQDQKPKKSHKKKIQPEKPEKQPVEKKRKIKNETGPKTPAAAKKPRKTLNKTLIANSLLQEEGDLKNLIECSSSFANGASTSAQATQQVPLSYFASGASTSASTSQATQQMLSSSFASGASTSASTSQRAEQIAQALSQAIQQMSSIPFTNGASTSAQAAAQIPTSSMAVNPTLLDIQNMLLLNFMQNMQRQS